MVGQLLAEMLVIILAGVFDPPPTAPIIGWGAVGLQLVFALIAMGLATAGRLGRLRALSPGNTLREAWQSLSPSWCPRTVLGASNPR